MSGHGREPVVASEVVVTIRRTLLVIGVAGALAGWLGCRGGPPPEVLFSTAEHLRLEYTLDASQRAIAMYQHARSDWKRYGDYRDAARATRAIGDTYERMGRLKDSLAGFTEALVLSQQSGDPLLESRIRSDVGVAQARLGNSARASEQCRAALDLAERFAGTGEEARAHYCLAEVDYHRGDSADALTSYRAAERLWRRLDDKRGLAETLLLIGSAQADVNELDDARRYLDESWSLWKALEDDRGRALTDLAMARLDLLPGAYQPALNRLTDLRERFSLAGDVVWEAACLTSIAYVYERMGDRPNALRQWAQASELFETAGLQMAALEVFIRLGTGYLADDTPRALGWFEKALALSEASGNQHMRSWALRFIGLVRLAQGDSKRALDFLQQSLIVQRAIKDPRTECQTLADAGAAEAALGNLSRATEYFRQALDLSEASGSRIGQAVALFGLARTSAGADDLDAARGYVERALKIVESLRTAVESHDLRASYVASIHQYHELYLDVLMRLNERRPRQGLAAAAFAASERARALAARESG